MPDFDQLPEPEDAPDEAEQMERSAISDTIADAELLHSMLFIEDENHPTILWKGRPWDVIAISYNKEFCILRRIPMIGKDIFTTVRMAEIPGAPNQMPYMTQTKAHNLLIQNPREFFLGNITAAVALLWTGHQILKKLHKPAQQYQNRTGLKKP